MPQLFCENDKIETAIGGINLTRTSTVSKKQSTMFLPITEDQYHAWQDSGTMIQDAFPNLTPDQREFILSGITKEEWEITFPEEEDE